MRTRSWSGPPGWRHSSWRAVAPGQRRCWGPAGAALRCSAGRAGRPPESMNRCSTGSAGPLHRLPLLRERTAPCATLQPVVQTSRWGNSSTGRRAAYAESWANSQAPAGSPQAAAAAGAQQERTTAHTRSAPPRTARVTSTNRDDTGRDRDRDRARVGQDAPQAAQEVKQHGAAEQQVEEVRVVVRHGHARQDDRAGGHCRRVQPVQQAHEAHQPHDADDLRRPAAASALTAARVSPPQRKPIKAVAHSRKGLVYRCRQLVVGYCIRLSRHRGTCALHACCARNSAQPRRDARWSAHAWLAVANGEHLHPAQVA